MLNPIVDKTTTSIAVGAVASPWWLPTLSEVSHTAGQLLPIAGLVWILVQFLAVMFRRK